MIGDKEGERFSGWRPELLFFQMKSADDNSYYMLRSSQRWAHESNLFDPLWITQFLPLHRDCHSVIFKHSTGDF